MVTSGIMALGTDVWEATGTDAGGLLGIEAGVAMGIEAWEAMGKDTGVATGKGAGWQWGRKLMLGQHHSSFVVFVMAEGEGELQISHGSELTRRGE